MRTLLLGILLCCCVSAASAQLTYSTSGFTKDRSYSPAGRDMWFALLKNYDDQPGKYFQLYVTSASNTVVHVVSLQGTKVLPVQANRVATFNVPLGWEMKTSGVVEDKGIRVYSDDAEIACYLMSHNPYTSDGYYVIPNLGLGRDYVVAGYASLFEGFGGFAYDYPSEFLVVANRDSTLLHVTPSSDIRGRDSSIAHPAGKTFTQRLNRGQCVQYLLAQTQSTDSVPRDVTGTRVTSNYPVGVVGGSTCPNIPADFPYCDHVCDMVPPIRTWGKKYYTSNFFQTDQGHDASTILVVGTQNNQSIYRFDAATGNHRHCILANAFDHNFQPDVTESSRFQSNYPFMLVQYINSSTYPNGNNGNGDPAMVVIPAADNLSNTVLLQTPTSVGAQSPYINYINVITAHPDQTTFDGQKITRYTAQQVDGVAKIFRIPNVQPGTHVIKSDTAVGAYVYGYGFDESYAWTGSLPMLPLDSTDIIPPTITPHVAASCIHLVLADTGSGLAAIRLDSGFNISYNRDTTFFDGDSTRTSFVDLCVFDTLKPASAWFTVYDMAQNRTVFQMNFIPAPLKPQPGFTISAFNFDSTLIKTVKIAYSLTVNDTSELPVTIDGILSSSSYIIFDTSIPLNHLPVTLSPHAQQTFDLTFKPLFPERVASQITVHSIEAGSRILTVTGLAYSNAGVESSEFNTWLNASTNKLKVGPAVPNPSEGSTSIPFGLRSSSKVSADIYSILGEQMIRLDLGEFAAGVHSAPMDLSSLLPGSYIIRLSANGEAHSVNVTLTK